MSQVESSSSQVSVHDRVVKAWVVKKAGDPFELSEITLPELQPDEVEIKFTHCGLCATDLGVAEGHVLYRGWTQFPVVCGHEGVGIITARGSCVSSHCIGDRVGMGCYRGSCGICYACTHGQHDLCTKAQYTLFAQYGGFSTYGRIKANMAIPIPDGIDSAYVGPLMCAGATVFAPFRNHNILSGESVGVVGIGGLGALAIQIGRAHGCEMVAMSSSSTKKDLATNQLGAHRYVDLSNADEVKANTGRLNYILVTTPTASLDWSSLVAQLMGNGKIFLLGISPETVPVHIMPLIMGQKSINGSHAGSVGLTIDLLRLVALHKIRPIIEKFPFSQVNEAARKLAHNQVRFRVVLEHSQ